MRCPPPFLYAALAFGLFTSCGSFVSPQIAFAAGKASKPPNTSDDAPPPPPDIFIDVETQSQLGGIPYFVDSQNKVSVATFAKLAGPPPVVDKRVAFTGFKPTPTDGFIGIDREFEGDVEFRATVGVNSSAGITSGFATGYTELNFPPVKKGEDPMHHAYLGATRDSFSGGFVIQGWDSNFPVGFPLTIQNTNVVDLLLTRTGGNIIMSARTTPATPDIEGGWIPVVTIPDPMVGVPCSLEFGAESLDKGGQMFFDYFYVGGPTVGGSAETLPMTNLNLAVDKCDQSIALVDQTVPDFAGASAILINALTDITNTQTNIDQAVAGGTFQDGTREDLARKSAEKARKALVKARAGCDAGNIKKKATILKGIRDARSNCVTAIANLAGVKASTDKKFPIY